MLGSSDDRRQIFSGDNEFWKPAPVAVRAAASAAVTSQLQAFKRDDYAAGLKLQSTNLKSNFSSVAVFRAMLKQNYPQFANFKSITFDDARYNSTAKRVALRVTLIGMDGITLRAVYFLVREGNGYLIDGVRSRNLMSSGSRPPSLRPPGQRVPPAVRPPNISHAPTANASRTGSKSDLHFRSAPAGFLQFTEKFERENCSAMLAAMFIGDREIAQNSRNDGLCASRQIRFCGGKAHSESFVFGQNAPAVVTIEE